MAWLKNMSLRKSFFVLTFAGLFLALLLLLALWRLCLALAAQYPSGGVAFEIGGSITRLPSPTPEELRILNILYAVPTLGCIIFPILGLSAAAALFFRWKLQPPIKILLDGTRRIQNHDLDFVIAETAPDELGQVCAAFETMRAGLLQTNQQLWRQAEERRRLNAAFAHDLRNPVTVLKGTVKLLRRGQADEKALERLAAYTERIEQYIDGMSSIQRLEQLPLKISSINGADLAEELAETAHMLAPQLNLQIQAADLPTLQIDYGLFLTVAENLINNAARFAEKQLKISLNHEQGLLCLTVSDDGPGYPAEMLQNSPRPFAKSTAANHMGMGLYTGSLLCQKHGGSLRLQNSPNGGAEASAFFKIFADN